MFSEIFTKSQSIIYNTSDEILDALRMVNTAKKNIFDISSDIVDVFFLEKRSFQKSKWSIQKKNEEYIVKRLCKLLNRVDSLRDRKMSNGRCV